MNNVAELESSQRAAQTPRLLRGFMIAVSLSFLFLVITAYQSAATLFSRIDQTQVMKAASGAAITGRIAADVTWFLAAQILLHLAFAAAAWGLAVASAVLWRIAREKFGRIVVGWFSLLGAATIAYNAYWYPRTLMGAYYHDIVAVTVGTLPVAQLAYWGVVVGAVLTLVAAGRKYGGQVMTVRPDRRALLGAAAVVVGLGAVLWSDVRAVNDRGTSDRRPNVIILGIDSLRLEHLRRFGGAGNMPQIDQFLADADIFRDATTPAARTFSSWTAILTGRSPTVTGARFNLAARSSVSATPTLGDVLRAEGYKAVYSTDEVRFANIDETFGFDQVITPRIGASDFLIGTYNELPLASVIINTRLGQWLFPYSHANRGVATMFRPETYLGRVERELSFDGPTLFVAHLTAPHWPYYVSDTPFGMTDPDGTGEHPLYHVGMATADRMFGDMIRILKRKGGLENALVVILSDHGEAFGLAGDTLFGQNHAAVIEGLRAPIKMNDHGHGQSVLSPSQYKVLLGFRSFGEFGGFRAAARNWGVPVTVEDITPTILDLLAVRGDPLKATGQSLASFLAGAETSSSGFAQDRIRFTETDLAVLPGPGGGVDEVGTARQNSIFFNVDYETGRLELSKRYEPLAVAFKERAAFSTEMLLAALPAGPDAHQYLLFDLATGNGRLLLEAPGPEQPKAQQLWNALHDHYRGELKPAVAVTREDWPRIDSEWKSFLDKRHKEDGRASARTGEAEPLS